ncbi:MAG: hypothetical protein KBC43_13475 [Bacteroidales bacterium]|nr:hypothetical protein [Bacteroidales bacterium]
MSSVQMDIFKDVISSLCERHLVVILEFSLPAGGWNLEFITLRIPVLSGI